MSDLSRTIVEIGNSKFPFVGYRETSEAYLAAIHETGATCSGRTGPMAPKCKIKRDGNVIAHLSYNGKVWDGDDDCRNQPNLIYSPYQQSCGAV